jgi:hypothetical protein
MRRETKRKLQLLARREETRVYVVAEVARAALGLIDDMEDEIRRLERALARARN